MKTKIFTLLFLATTFIFGCSKDDNTTSNEPSTNGMFGVWMVYTPD